LSETLVANLSLPGTAGSARQLMSDSKMLNDVLCLSVGPSMTNEAQTFALDANDSWHIGLPRSQGRVSQLMGGKTMIFENSENLIANHETSLRFGVLDREGGPATLQPYMGMLGHAVVRRSDGAVFTHLHPVGTISMAAQEMLSRRELGTSGERMGPASSASSVAMNEVSFPYAFPRPGNYRLWVQVRTGGQVLTGVFDVRAL